MGGYTRKQISFIIVVLFGGFSAVCFVSNRPGDFESGVFGMVIGGTIGSLVMLPEVVAAWRKRRVDQS